MSTDRREFLKLLSTAAAASAFPASISRALAIPANQRTGSLNDVEHVVFMMQENRSFDHYFGTLRGVRGFGDPRAVKVDREQGHDGDGAPNAPRYSIPLCAGGCVHGVRRVPLLAAWTDGPESLSHVD